MANMTTTQKSGLAQLNGVLNNETMKKKFENILDKNAGAFMASILELYQTDSYLQQCNPNDVVLEALKAATLKLPINKNLGFGYIVPYKGKPQFQIGYKGIVQLCQRSGSFKYMNAGPVYEGQTVKYNYVTGALEITGEPKTDKAIGYFAFFELTNGFQKSDYWTVEKVINHAKRYSAAYKNQKKDSPWFTAFDSMAEKTVMLHILKRYAPMSTEFQQILDNDNDDRIEAEVNDNANQTPVTIPTDFADEPEQPKQQPKQEAPKNPTMDDLMNDDEGPGF